VNKLTSFAQRSALPAPGKIVARHQRITLRVPRVLLLETVAVVLKR
jgi:hypothetical protein